MAEEIIEDSVSYPAGYYTYESIELATSSDVYLDIRMQVQGIVIYEDLFSPFMTGTIFMEDNNDLLGVIGRMGLNVLHIKIHSPHSSRTIQQNFQIYSVTEVEMNKANRTQTYKLNFITEEGIVDLKSHSLPFEGRPAQIITNLLRDTMKIETVPIIAWEANNTIKFVSSYWPASKIIDFVCSRALTTFGVKDSASYVFFQNRNGFNFVPMEYLYGDVNNDMKDGDDVLFRFDQNDFTTDVTDDGMALRNTDRDHKKIIASNLDRVFDYIADHREGALKTSMIVNDPILKRFSVEFSNIGDVAEKRLNNYFLYNSLTLNNTSQRHMRMTKFWNNYSSGDSSNYRYIQDRVAKLAIVKSFKIEIEVFGKMDYTVGTKIHASFNRNVSVDAENTGIIDNVRSGYYIISAISHRFRRDGYYCTMELMKDSTDI